ncbi:MAG: hypothetical protein PWR13_413 [Archaeoglobi archaeon]|nr:hypothetical protein [Archaeoglobi archaeon]
MSGDSATLIISKFILNIAILLIVARIAGDLTNKYLRQPPVLGELIAGIIIGPYALGSLINDPILLNFGEISFNGTHFSLLEVMSMIAVIILLFVAGVETDVRKFVRYGKSAGAVAVGGVVFSFLFGYYLTLLFGYSQVSALFMGAVLTATSVGITVRVLLDIGKIDTPEGITILGAAVIDDVLGIIVLTLVLSLEVGDHVSIGHLLQIAAIAFIFWFAIVAIGLKFSEAISKYILEPFKEHGGMPLIALFIGFIIAYLSTLVHLHPVIGAYAAGLMFAATDEKHEIIQYLHPVYSFFVPLFFVSMGMQVDLFVLKDVAVFGVVLVVAAIISKIFGCAIFARVSGFNWLGSVRIGAGMVPRGEVGLITAGAALLEGAISLPMYAAAVAVSMVSTLITPPMLKPLFGRGGSGLKEKETSLQK